jgi:hypothetical protein
MSAERNPVWPWIVVLLIGLPVLYVVAFGPACWLASYGYIEPDRIATLYKPVLSSGIADEYAIIGSRKSPYRKQAFRTLKKMAAAK